MNPDPAMTDPEPHQGEGEFSETQKPPKESTLHRVLIGILLALMLVEWGLLLYRERWLSAFLVTLIIIALLIPAVFRKKLELEIPAEFHLTAVIFIMASLYLGEVYDFYYRLWWWDIALHTTAGLLMGVLGFLLVYVLNESRRVELHMTPAFIAFVAFTFAVTTGTIWEIFEFSMDQLAGTQMQKPMLGDDSGLTDTMWDMIVNALGAGLISLMGWWYLKREQSFFVKDWIRKFINSNPALFRH
jgi:uncharacterized membrane protein YjdF